MPEQTVTTTETVEPLTTTGGPSLEASATEAVLDPDGVGIRAPSFDEGAVMWEIARDAGTLDLNSPYAYLMQSRNFQDTCAIAEIYGRPAGFVAAHRLPGKPDVLFVWQIGVLPEFRGFGIGRRLLEDLLAREANAGVRTIETTITPSNKASIGLFSGFAKACNAEVEVLSGFTADTFPDDAGHEPEQLYVISPVAAVS